MKELVERLPAAVKAVREEGICAVLECKLGEDLSAGEVEEEFKGVSSG